VSIDVSVVIPTFRRPEQLRKAIESALGQNGVTTEVLVVDDSPEGSAQNIVSCLDDERIRYLKNPAPTGGFPSVVRNIGWPLARGRFVHFLDDDDIVPDNHYAAVKAKFLANPRVGVVFGRVEPFGDAPDVQMNRERRFFDDAGRRAAVCARFGSRLAFTASMVFGYTLIVCGAAVMRVDGVRKLGGFDPRIRLGEDVKFFGRAMREFGAAFIDGVALNYHIGNPSMMHAPQLSDIEIQHYRDGVRLMHGKYRAARGSLEFYALKIFSRLVLLPCISILK
jgi:glycosyltransferase involved in cell wall biosynthesis